MTGLILAFALITGNVHIGTPDNFSSHIEAFEMRNFKAYYGADSCEYLDTYYTPDNMAVIARCQRTEVKQLMEIETKYYSVITFDNKGRRERFRPSQMTTGQANTLENWLIDRNLKGKR